MAVRRVLLVQPLHGSRWRSISAYAGSLESMLREAGIEVAVAEAPWFNPPSLVQGARVRWASAQTVRDAQNGEFDIIHLTDQALAHHVGRFRAAASVVVTVHDLMPFTTPGYYATRREGALKRAFLRKPTAAIARTDRVIAVSEFTRRELRQHLGISDSCILTVPNVIREAFAARSREGAERALQEAGIILPPRPRIVSVGNDRAYKNLPALLRALAEQRLSSASLVRVGARLNRGQLQLAGSLAITHRIRQLGSLSDEHLALVYAASDVLAQPSIGEGFGIPVIEAMACGLPVVTSNGGSLPEVVGSAGLVVALAGDQFVPRLASAIEQATSERERFAELGLRRAEAFTPAAVVPVLLRAYEQAFR